MIANVKPYAEYRESGLPWLGQVPGHWVTKRGESYLVSIDEQGCLSGTASRKPT